MSNICTTCTRTGRLCEGGAFDGKDGWGIDCPTTEKETCKWRICMLKTEE